MSRTRGITTKIINAKNSSDSLRVTVPSFITKTLHIRKGDELSWEIESLENGIIKVMIVRSSRGNSGEMNKE